VCIDLEKFYKSIGGTINYHEGASCCFGNIVRASFRLSYKLHQNSFRSFSCNKLSFEQIYLEMNFLDSFSDIKFFVGIRIFSSWRRVDEGLTLVGVFLKGTTSTC
jgi:hypothetical protein